MKFKGFKLAKNLSAILGLAFVLVPTSFLIRNDAVTGDYSTFDKQSEESVEYLPTFAKQMEFYKELGIETCYMSYNQTTSVRDSKMYNTRISAPDEAISINILIDDLTDKQKADFTQAVEDIDDIFDVINPNYNFEIDFEPTQAEKDKKYNINVSLDDSLVGSDTSGYWAGNLFTITKNGLETSHSFIKLNPETGKRYRVLAHEILHHLGLGDAYVVSDDLKCETIMNGDTHIRKNDVGLLAGKYGNYSTEENKAKLIDFVQHYEENQTWRKKEIATVQEDSEDLKRYASNTLGISADEISAKIPVCFGKIESQKDDYDVNHLGTLYQLSDNALRLNEYSATLLSSDNRLLTYAFTIDYDLQQIDNAFPCYYTRDHHFSYFFSAQGTVYSAHKQTFIVTYPDGTKETDSSWAISPIGMALNENQINDFQKNYNLVKNGSDSEIKAFFNFDNTFENT